MARTRKPTLILENSGAFDHDPKRKADRENEPVPPGPLGDPPPYFEPDEVAIWKQTAEQAAEGVLTCSDRVLLEMYCLLVARLRRREPLKAAEQNMILTFLSRMGFTPADRSRLNVPTKQKQKTEDVFGRLASTGRGVAKLNG